MTEGRKIAAILVADVVGYSRLIGADEEGALARLGALRNELFAPAVEAHGGRVVNRTGDGALVEFRSVVEAVRCALEITKGLAEPNPPLPPEQRIELRIGVHLGDVIEAADGDLFGDAVNIAARLEGICPPGGICLSEDAWRQVRDRLPETFVDLGEQSLKNIARPMRVYALGGTQAAPSAARSGSKWPTRALPAEAIDVIETVARATDGYAGPPSEAAGRIAGASRHPRLSKAADILETVERIVDALADRKARRDARPPDPLPDARAPSPPQKRRRPKPRRAPSDAGSSSPGEGGA